MIDLRSDTVTRPSPEMREAIAAAPVGDDQFGEDPTVNLLQERIAALLEKESALWLPTGTMANQVALRVLTQPGDDVIVSQESHAVWHETGGSAANAGVQFTAIGKKGFFTPEDFLAALKSRDHIIYPPTTLVEIENTHNRSGGTIFPQDDVERICAAAAEREIATYLDGARLWNAAIASNRRPAELAVPFGLVSVALSKGLGAPGALCLPDQTQLSSAEDDTGECWGVEGGKAEYSQQQGFLHSTTTSSDWPMTTQTLACLQGVLPGAQRSLLTWPMSKQISWSLAWLRTALTRQLWLPKPRSVAFLSSRLARGLFAL